MKTLNTFALGMVIFVSSAFSQLTAGNPDPVTAPKSTNYMVVIGAFSIHKNAIRFTNAAVKKQITAKYEMNLNRNLYYVYVMNTDNRQAAIDEALRLRKESPYNDTWVYNGMLGQAGVEVKGTDINPVTQQGIQEVPPADPAVQSAQTTAAGAPAVVAQGSSTEAAASAVVTQESSTASAVATQESGTETVSKTESTPEVDGEGKNFYFKIFRQDDKTQIEGEVNVIDVTKAKKMGTYAGNKSVRITAPTSKDGNVSMTCEIFGFRKVQQDLNFQNPQGEGITVEDNSTVIPFELMRLQKGDFAIMYNVYFFKDAAVMRPESRYEVTSLLTMLQENPKYKIRLHGHTNGNAHGKIISRSSESKDYFSLNNTKDGIGSAKRLSEERAEVIRDFLVSNGIDINRMQIKAWGGKRAIHDKHSPQAQSNVRVEIEILEN